MPEKDNKTRGNEITKDEPDNNLNDNLSKMINASRAFRNLPPEFTMGRKFDKE